MALVPSLVAAAVSPLLLSTLSRMWHAGEREHAQKLARNALRAVVLLLPFAGLTAGAGPDIVALVFGPRYVAASSLLALLIFGALAFLLGSVATTILVATNQTRWAIILTAPLIPLAVAGHIVFIPRAGPLGAASVTTSVAAVGALASVVAVSHTSRMLLPRMTVLRSGAICALTYVLARGWPTPDLMIVVKLTGLALVVAVAFWLLGEFGLTDIAAVRSVTSGLRAKWRRGSAR